MDEVSEQQRNLIADLQTQIVELRKRIDDFGTTPKVLADLAAPRATEVIHVGSMTSILWVDDHPKSNSYFVEQLTNLGVKVDLASSTSEALLLFGRRKYSGIISDMGRRENGVENWHAGIDFLKAVRGSDTQIPFIIFCSSRGARQYSSEALSLGVTRITSSPTDLAEFLNLDALSANA